MGESKPRHGKNDMKIGFGYSDAYTLILFENRCADVTCLPGFALGNEPTHYGEHANADREVGRIHTMQLTFDLRCGKLG